MKKICFCAVCVLIFALLFSCGDTGKDPLAYQTGNISAEIAILKNGCRIGAVLHITDAGNVDMTLTSPETVKGTVIKRTDGEVSVSRGGLTSDAEVYLAAAELFSLDGNILSAETAELDGKKLTRIRVGTVGGEREVYLSENNTPVRISSESLTVDVVWFESN